MKEFSYDVVVIGGGPAGLAAAIAANNNGASVALIEREAKLGGILKQCIHDGFGLVRYGEKLTGPEYAQRDIDAVYSLNIPVFTLTYVTALRHSPQGSEIDFVSRDGCGTINAKKLILATGCRERTSKQVAIHGTNPAGVLTAGTAQHYINLLGLMPARRCVILGSGDIGLIMARRLTLEGAKVLGVYEAKPTLGGLTRNYAQCLQDYGIPLHLSHTVTRVYGKDRLEGVEICRLNDKMQVVEGSEQYIECDGLILSVGLIPEVELGKMLNVPLSPRTHGAEVDQHFMTLVTDVYSCGNATHVNDLVDYVSESGRIAGTHAATSLTADQRVNRNLIKLNKGDGLLYAVPQYLNVENMNDAVVYFRAASECDNMVLTVTDRGKQLFVKRYKRLRPPEMERITLPLADVSRDSVLSISLEKGQ